VQERYASELHVHVGSGLTDSWIVSNDLHYLVWQTIDDGEGYVRAAVVHALTSLRTNDILWRDFTRRHVSQARNNCYSF